MITSYSNSTFSARERSSSKKHTSYKDRQIIQYKNNGQHADRSKIYDVASIVNHSKQIKTINSKQIQAKKYSKQAVLRQNNQWVPKNSAKIIQNSTKFDNAQYIRNLYKKYLGKENSSNSESKLKTDYKENRNPKYQNIKGKPDRSSRKNTNYDNNYDENLLYSQENVKNYQDNHLPPKYSMKINEEPEYQNSKKNVKDNIKKQLIFQSEEIKKDFYHQMLDCQWLDFIGNNRLVSTIKLIKKAKQNILRGSIL